MKDFSTFVSNSNSSGFGFYDLILSLLAPDHSGSFTKSIDPGNAVVFCNVKLVYVITGTPPELCFIDVIDGSVFIKNVSFSDAAFNSSFINTASFHTTPNISILASNFSNLNIVGDKGDDYNDFLDFMALYDLNDSASILINSTIFNGINTSFSVIYLSPQNDNQVFTFTNNVFTDIVSYGSALSIFALSKNVVNIENTTWTNVFSEIGSVVFLSTIPPVLNNLQFSNCRGTPAGAIFFWDVDFILSNSVFVNNSVSGEYSKENGNDIVQLTAEGGKHTITNCSSSSALPKAVVLDFNNNNVTDISDELPNPSQIVARTHSNSQDTPALPRFRFWRKVKKN